MTTRRENLTTRMTAAAAARKAGATPSGKTAVRTKPVRITIDLDPGEYRQLKRWLASAAATLNPDWPDLTQMTAVRAMIHYITTDTAATSAVLDQLQLKKT